jgi:predicted ATPase
VIVTATRSGSETNYARFGDFFSGSIADPAADLDKDGQTSLLEAFVAASHRVGEFYKQEGRLPTEHALLDDNGDALGVSADWFQGLRATRAAKNGAPIDGPRARQWHLVLSGAERAIPADVRAKRDALELKIEALRAKKASIAEAEYYAQLEALLLQLARVYEPQPGSDPQPAGGGRP